MKRKSNQIKCKNKENNKLNLKRNNQFSLDSFIISKKTKEISDKPNKVLVNSSKNNLNNANNLALNTEKSNSILEEVKAARVERELLLVNKGIPQETKEKEVRSFSITYPIIIQTNLGILKQFPISEVKNFFELKNILFKLKPQQKKCIFLEYNNTIIGYISKEISFLLLQILSNPFFIVEYYIIGETLEIFIIINVNHLQFEINIKEDNQLNLLYSISYTPGKEKIVNSLVSQEIKILFQKSLNYQKFFEKITKILNDINNISLNETTNDDSQLYSSYLLANVEKVISMIKYYNYLFDKGANKFYENFGFLTPKEKEILVKFLIRSSKWVNIDKINEDRTIKTTIEIDHLVKGGFVRSLNVEEIVADYNNMFEFLSYLTVNELKEIDSFIQTLTKNKNAEVKSSKKGLIDFDLNFTKVSEIFINNPFYDLKHFISNKGLSSIIEQISKYYTSVIFNQELLSKQKEKEIVMNNFSKHYHKEITNNNYNKQYIDNNLNSSGFKKVHLIQNILTSKIMLILRIIENTDYYLKDRSSSIMDKFIKNSNPESKIEKLKIKFAKYSYLYSLNANFAKFFDMSTRLFFFYSEYKDINSVGKEFYGMDSFETFRNYVSNQLTNNQRSDLFKPIFTQKDHFELYDSLYQIKIAYNIAELSFLNKESLQSILYNILNKLFVSLLKFSNQILFDKINENFKLNCEDNKVFVKINLYMIEVIEQTYSNNPTQLEDSFLLKYSYSHISNELLTYFCDVCERNRYYQKANFIYLFLILSKHLVKKRGHWWYRAILNFSHHLKSKFNAIKLLNCIKFDVCNSKVIKSGYLVKIKELYNRFMKEKINQKNNKVLNLLKADLFFEGNVVDKFFNQSKIEKNEKPIFSLPNIFKTIHSDSAISDYNGRRIYASAKQGVINVEQYALDYYLEHDSFVGIHGENEVIPSLLNVFLWDCIYYDNIPFVFQSPYQSFPLDFFYPEFYLSRKEIIDLRLEQIEKYTVEDIISYINKIFEKKKNIKTVFLNWKSFTCTKENLINISIAFTPVKMVKVFKEIVKNIKFVIKGMPDLFLWKIMEEKFVINGKEIIKKSNKAIWGSLKIVEVKSTNDKLSDHQKYWLNLLYDCGLEVEVLHII